MPRIPVLGLGTYYTKFGMQFHGEIPGAHELRQWAFLAKDGGGHGSATLRHPSSSDRTAYILKSPIEAQGYAGFVGAELIPAAFERFGISNKTTFLVPIPASCTTRATAGGRWPGLGIARDLEARGCGKVVTSVFHKAAVAQAHAGGKLNAKALFDSLECDRRAFFPWHRVVYIDDLFTWGSHVAAVHDRIGRPVNAMVFAIGCTDKNAVQNALEPRYRTMTYETLNERPHVADFVRGAT